MPIEVEAKKIAAMNSANTVLGLLFGNFPPDQWPELAEKVVGIQSALAEHLEAQISSSEKPDFSTIKEMVEDLSKAAFVKPPVEAADKPFASAEAPESPAEPQQDDGKKEESKTDSPQGRPPESPAGKKEEPAQQKTTKAVVKVVRLKGDNTAFLGEDGHWYVFKNTKKIYAQIVKDATLTVYYTKGKTKDRFLTAVYAQRS